MKRPTHITVEKAILIAARQRALEIDANLSHVIESLLSMWLAGRVRTLLEQGGSPPDRHPLEMGLLNVTEKGECLTHRSG